ncbi:MAG: hypothetical protein J6D52_11905 [Clostridia bacterium]|nr:hypothetical protein [Clostridia bacterium]
MYAPQIDTYAHHLADRYRHNYDIHIPFDSVSVQNIEELFRLIKQIKPTKDKDIHELWLSAETGPIEAFGDYDEMYEDGQVDSREEFEEWWKSYYPYDQVWYNMCTVEREDNGYKCIFLNHKMVIEIDHRKKNRTFEEDISEFTTWLLEEVKKCLAELKAGTYNKRINRELPCGQKTGTILLKDLWDLFPQRRADFFEDISQTEIEEFVTLMDKQRKDDSDRIKHLTVNDFFSLCALGYKANNYEGTDLSPREQYYLHADGRDDDLGKINPDSVEEFRDWLLNKLKYGHPWEVCRGGNSTHISLYVGYDEAGFFLILAGSAWTRTIETVKFYLALINAGFPVYLRDGKILASRLLETERIGVVPDGVFPCYCEMLFPGEHIIDFMNLPYENREQIAELCVWQDINPTELMDD